MAGAGPAPASQAGRRRSRASPRRVMPVVLNIRTLREVPDGAVYIADAAGRPVAIRETDKLEGAFASRAEVTAVHDRLETWSQLAFDALSTADSTRTGPPGL